MDAYNEYKQHTGFLTALEEQLAIVMSETLQVAAMEWRERDEFALDVLAERNGKLHRVDVKSVELVQRSPNGHRKLAAF